MLAICENQLKSAVKKTAHYLDSLPSLIALYDSAEK
jgi:hypothetical protein